MKIFLIKNGEKLSSRKIFSVISLHFQIDLEEIRQEIQEEIQQRIGVNL